MNEVAIKIILRTKITKLKLNESKGSDKKTSRAMIPKLILINLSAFPIFFFILQRF